MNNIKFHIDDFGVFPSLNKDIIHFIKQKKIDSISIICNSRFSKNSIKLLNKLIDKKKVDVCCHINLTEFNAKKYKLSFLKLFFFSIFCTKKINELVHHITEAQIDFFLKNINIKKKFILIDGHQHIHILPLVQKNINKILNRKKVKFKYRNSNEVFFFFFELKYLNKLLLNYFKLLIIKLSYLIFKQNKNYFNKNFIGVIGTGIQSKKIILKALSKISNKSDYTQVLFHPLKIKKKELLKYKLDCNDYRYYLSNERKKEKNFLKSFKTKNFFLSEQL